jgi:hypothetical protein
MTILFILSTILVAKMLFRWRLHHAWYGGGCRRRRNFRRGPIDLGAPDDDFPPRGGRFRRSWQRWQREADVPNLRRNVAAGAATGARAPRRDVASALELNQRQQQLFDEVMERARNWVEPANLADALAAVGREPFDRAEVETLVGSVEISDDFEHFHHSLTAEQRAKLREVTAASN